MERGLEIGLTIQDKNYMVMININSIHQVSSSTIQQEIQNYIKRVVLPQIKNLIEAYDEHNWLVFRSNTIILFLSSQNNTINISKFCNKLLYFFKDNPNLSVSIGASNYFNIYTDLPSAYHQALQAVTVGRQHYGENKIVYYDQVWFFQKLRQMGEEESTQRVCYRLLNPVTEYDKIHGTQLTETLNCLLQNNGNVKITAEQMYVHKNTMLQRKNKILEIFGYSPFEMPYLLNFLMVFDIILSSELPLKV